MPGLDLFEHAILVLQIGLDLSRVLQNECDCAVDFRQRTDGRIGLENRLRRTSSPKIIRYIEIFKLRKVRALTSRPIRVPAT